MGFFVPSYNIHVPNCIQHSLHFTFSYKSVMYEYNFIEFQIGLRKEINSDKIIFLRFSEIKYLLEH